MPKTTDVWTNEELHEIYRLRNDESKGWKEIAEILKTKSAKSLERKYGRMDWDKFLKDPDVYNDIAKARKWTNDEMVQLDAYLQAAQSYDFIAEKLGRTISSVESQAQHTDWKAWRAIRKETREQDVDSKGEENEQKNLLIEQYIDALLTLCRHDFKRIDATKEAEFLSRVNLEKSKLFISYTELKQKAKERLIELGFGNEETMSLGKGKYVIVGDSHGKHTNKDMFDMLERVNKTVKPQKIIHVGHILDDNNDISYDWGRFSNLVILSRVEELKIIQEQRNKFNFNYDVVRESILVGKDLSIFNQDIISDFVRTSISSLDSETFDDKIVVNCHRMEMTTRCSNEGQSYFASPGCLCEEHIIRTVKQIDFEDGRVVKQAFHEGFIKYRRMRHMTKYWERGLLIVEVNDDGSFTIIPCPIKKTIQGPQTMPFTMPLIFIN